jgi:hypothetical protein
MVWFIFFLLENILIFALVLVLFITRYMHIVPQIKKVGTPAKTEQTKEQVKLQIPVSFSHKSTILTIAAI